MARAALTSAAGYDTLIGAMGAAQACTIVNVDYRSTNYSVISAGTSRLGVPLLVLDLQLAAIPLLEKHMKPQDRHVDITLHDNAPIGCAQSRDTLRAIGIDGQIVHTPGHSDRRLLDVGAGTIYPGHGPIAPMYGADRLDV